MKRRWKITAGLVVLAAVCALLWPGTGNRAQQELEETRAALRQQGFKIDLREFNFSTSPEQARRAASLGTTTWAALTNRPPRAPIMHVMPALLTPAGTNAALVAWRLEKLPPYRSPETWPLSGTGYLDADLWPELRKTLKANRARLEAARQAALSGPIRFEPIRGPRPNALLPYLSDIRDLTAAFAVQTLLALHEGDGAAAWTNLLATTCLVTAYRPEPIDQSHLVRFACAVNAYDITWNALQSRDWPDERLAELQRRWEAVDFWSGLAETAAWTRANVAATCQLERRQPPAVPLKDLLHSPKDAWFRLTQHWHWLRYRNHGSYQDEKAVLLYYRDRELELRRALRSPTWSEMRQLPGITNLVPSRPGISLRVQAHMNTQVLLSAFYLRGQGLLGRAAEAEARRRLLVTALALERYRGRHGSYPAALEQLVPELLNSPPTDFMDGKPLRYRVAEDGHFVLYSTGLDCVDNGAQMGRPGPGLPYSVARALDSWQGSDLVWPRPASAAEVELLRQQEKQARAEQIDRMEEMQAAAQWDRTARRQAQLQTILLGRTRPITREPVYRGRSLSEVLRNEKASGTNKLTLADLLTPKQIITGAEPETATFELALNFDVLTNVASLRLYIDPTQDEDSSLWGCDVGQLECNRATNGNCLLVCSTIYESPGEHALQVRLFGTPSELDADIAGPLVPFVVSNLCQFSLSSAAFDPESGATFRAKLPELNGACTTEVKSPTGEHLKTITGTTSNGILKVHWDLTDDRGRTYTNGSFDSVFRVTLPDSRRSQTLNGP